MAIENMQLEAIDFDEDEGEVHLEGELVGALEEIERMRKKNKSHKELLDKEKVETVEAFLLQIEEGKKIQGSLNQ